MSERQRANGEHSNAAAIGRVARLHLVDRFGYTWLVWGILALTFVLNMAIWAVIPTPPEEGFYTGALMTIYVFMVVIGVQAATKFLPFAMTLGVSRRTYFIGTVVLVVGLCLLYAGILTALWWIEGLTNGWGINGHFFRVPWILDGPWYQVWLTSFALLALSFLAGLWTGLVFRRFGLVGTVVFLAGFAVAAVVAAMAVTWRQAWPQVWRFLVDLNILDASLFAGLLAVLVSLGGYLTIRRITV